MFMKCSLSVFFLLLLSFCIISKNSLPNPRPWIFAPIFSPKRFIVFVFMFRCSIHCELVFVCSPSGQGCELSLCPAYPCCLCSLSVGHLGASHLSYQVNCRDFAALYSSHPYVNGGCQSTRVVMLAIRMCQSEDGNCFHSVKCCDELTRRVSLGTKWAKFWPMSRGLN